MGLLKPATNNTAFLKLGLQGFEGSGKTYLANEFALGMTKIKHAKGGKVAFFDTEKGSDFWIKKYAEHGIQLEVARSRAFVDLLQVIRESVAGGYDFLIIDSITHVWRELQTSYLKKTGKKQMSMHGWVTLKTEWAQFTDLYVNSAIHIAMCGRAGYEYDNQENEDGKSESVKVGTKMRAEGETGFEPDLLIETYKVNIAETLTSPKAKKAAKGFVNRCVVIKDRSDLVNGKVFDKPKFKDFMPVINFLNLGGEQAQISQTNSQGVFERGSDWSWEEKQKQQSIALEELQAILIKKGLDGTSADAKKGRTEVLERVFGTSSKTALENMGTEILLRGIKTLKIEWGFQAPEAPPQGETKHEEIPFSN